jgi:hypothetical protein
MFCPRYRELLENAEHQSRKRSAGVRQAPAGQKAGLGAWTYQQVQQQHLFNIERATLVVRPRRNISFGVYRSTDKHHVVRSPHKPDAAELRLQPLVMFRATRKRRHEP